MAAYGELKCCLMSHTVTLPHTWHIVIYPCRRVGLLVAASKVDCGRSKSANFDVLRSCGKDTKSAAPHEVFTTRYNSLVLKFV